MFGLLLLLLLRLLLFLIAQISKYAEKNRSYFDLFA